MKLDTKAVVGVTIAIVLACVGALLFAGYMLSGDGEETGQNPSGQSLPSAPMQPEPEKDVAPPEPATVEEKRRPEGKDSGTTVPKTEPVLEVVPPDEVNPVPVEETAVDSLPEIGVNIPPAVNRARICFVIDDGGMNLENVRKYTSLPFPLTVAVLPRLSHSKECASLVSSSGKELILHQPMQAHDFSSGTTPDPGPGAVLPDMDSHQVVSTVNENLAEVGAGVRGINNHEGSLITEDREKMDSILSVAKSKGIYFLDSRTTSTSTVPQVAKEKGMTYIARYAPFLDNVVERDQMLGQLLKGLETANKNGYAVIIGHVDKSAEILPKLLADIYPHLVRKGYELTTPSSLLN